MCGCRKPQRTTRQPRSAQHSVERSACCQKREPRGNGGSCRDRYRFYEYVGAVDLMTQQPLAQASIENLCMTSCSHLVTCIPADQDGNGLNLGHNERPHTSIAASPVHLRSNAAHR